MKEVPQLNVFSRVGAYAKEHPGSLSCFCRIFAVRNERCYFQWAGIFSEREMENFIKNAIDDKTGICNFFEQNNWIASSYITLYCIVNIIFELYFFIETNYVWFWYSHHIQGQNGGEVEDLIAGRNVTGTRGLIFQQNRPHQGLY